RRRRLLLAMVPANRFRRTCGFVAYGTSDVLDVAVNAVIGERVEAPARQSSSEAAPPVAASAQRVELANPAVSVEVDFVAAVPVTEPRGRHACDDVVVVHPAVVLQRRLTQVLAVADTRAAER